MHITITVKTTLQALILFFLLCPWHATAQLPQCDRIYMDKRNIAMASYLPEIYTFDPTLPVGPNNPSLNTIPFPSGHAGLTVSPVLGSTNTTRTFYTSTYDWAVNLNFYWYYDPISLTWVNTGHSIGGLGPNLAAGGGYIYALDGFLGDVYRYDGTGNASFLVNVAGWIVEGPIDLVADCEGFYILNSTGKNHTPFLRKYSSSGTLLQSWTVNNPHNYKGTAGFAIIGDNIYIEHNYQTSPYTIDSVAIVSGVITPGVVNLNNISPALPQYLGGFPIGDLGSCERIIARAPHITIESTDTALCGAKEITYTANEITDRGLAPAYQWFINGVPVPGANDTFYRYTPQNGDAVACQLGINEPCVNTSPVMSNTITMVVDTAIQPVLVYDPDAFCTDRTGLVTPTLNTSGGIFTAAPGLAINSTTGEINPATSTPGSYTVTYTNPPPLVCPQYTDQAAITIYAAANAKIETALFAEPVCINDTVVLHTEETDFSSYTWEPSERLTGPKNDATAFVKRNQQGYIYLTVIAAGGCTARDSVYVDMGTSCCRVFLPSAFSPNNDGLNDVWKPIASDIQALSSLRVFNRFGQTVFESNKQGLSWDGTQNGQPCDLGVYFFIIQYTCDDGSEREQKGELTLVR